MVLEYQSRPDTINEVIGWCEKYQARRKQDVDARALEGLVTLIEFVTNNTLSSDVV